MNLIKMFVSKDLLPRTRFTAACGCNQGIKRKNNEDNFYFDGEYMNSDNQGLSAIREKRKSLREDSFFCVFDGMGGGEFGEIASYTGAKTAKEYLSHEEHMNPCDITPSLNNMCKAINEEVFRAGKNLGSSRMGSTLAGLYFHEGQVWVCNLGDSRCYFFRDRKMKKISQDHTDKEFMEENGITGRKPYLTQYLGIDPEEMTVVPWIRSYYLQRGDRFLICSDGLTDMVEEQQICNLLAENVYPEECVEALIKASLNGGGRDNITVIVVDVE